MCPLCQEVDALSHTPEAVTADEDSLPEGVIGYRRDGFKRYDPAFRERVARECHESGTSIAGIALRYGINANLVRKWMHKHPAQVASAFLPVSLSTLSPKLPKPVKSSSPATPRAQPVRQGSGGALTIELAGATVTVHGMVDANTLAAVLSALQPR